MKVFLFRCLKKLQNTLGNILALSVSWFSIKSEVKFFMM